MDAYSINRRLIRIHGRDVSLNLPKWQIVRAELQTEKRHGNYNVFYGDIFIRNETGVREVMKYYYMKPCWILEKLCVIYTKKEFEIMDRSHSYEPLYTFLDKNDKPLPLNWRVVEFIIGNYNRAERLVQRTEKDDMLDEQKRLISEQDRVKEILFGNDTDVSNALAYKEGIVVPSSYKSDNLVKGENNGSITATD